MDRLDPGLSKRPSRFDRKYLFDIPNRVCDPAIKPEPRLTWRVQDERVLYCEFWRQKLKDNALVDFPKKLCPPIAAITKGFSFAYMQEAFVATLLEIAHHKGPRSKLPLAGGKEKGGDDDDDDLDQYELWKFMKEQVKILREQIDNSAPDFVTARAGPSPQTPQFSAEGHYRTLALGARNEAFLPTRHRPGFGTGGMDPHAASASLHHHGGSMRDLMEAKMMGLSGQMGSGSPYLGRP